jgi:invasion protein IalB
MTFPAALLALLASLQLAAGPALASEATLPHEPLEVLEAADAEPSPWLPTCASDGRAGPLACSLQQRLIVQETGQPFLTLTFRVPRAGEQPVIAIQTPLGIYLPPGVALRVDDGEPMTLAIASCDVNGCHAGATLAEPLLAALEGGRTLHLVLHTDEVDTLDFEIPLAGFNRGFSAIR